MSKLTNLDELNPQKNFLGAGILTLILIGLSRLIAMAVIPLNDVTESRYAEIARKMLETGNWVTLQHDYGVPFWAKPPLSTWLAACSMKFFGVNEFAVRLPAFLLSIAIVWLIWSLAKKRTGVTQALLSTLVLSGTLYFLLDAGTVMTDPALIFCTTLVLVSFWHTLATGGKLWAYLFFVGLGLGLLAKGPIAIVLVAMPIFFWVLIYNRWRCLWKRLPWFTGSILMLLIALPWYIWAEIRTPGFLNYFIVGEHFHRFLTPGWTGDKYGFAHKEHWGMVWIYAACGIFPWGLVGVAWFWKYRQTLPHLFKGDDDGWMGYIFLCTVVPLIFFTFSSNIIYTYVFPSLPFFALFFTEYWFRAGALTFNNHLIFRLALICPLIFIIGTAGFKLFPDRFEKTQKPVVTAWKEQQPEKGSHLIYWDYKTEFSAQFYSAGQALYTQNNQELCKILAAEATSYIAISPERLGQISLQLTPFLHNVTTVTAAGRPLLLLKTSAVQC